MAADVAAETFSVEAVRANGESFAVDGLSADVPLSILAGKLCKAMKIAEADARTRLCILDGDRELSLHDPSEMLGATGIGPGTVLSVILTVKPQVFQFGFQVAGSEDSDFDSDGTLARLMLASDCFLVVKTYEADTDSGHVVQWDILYGSSYELEDGLATCSWDMHLRRVLQSRYDGRGHQRIPEGVMDSGWEKMDDRAFPKWWRIQTTDVVDDSVIAEKLESMTLDDLWDSITNDLRSNGMGQTEIDDWEEFLDEGDGIEADVLRKELLGVYRGTGTLSTELPLDVVVRLFPGSTLGPSGCWCRLPEPLERHALETAPRVDCNLSRLLGILVHGLENCWQSDPELVSDDGFDWRTGKPIDLSELRHLLKV